MFLSIRKLRQKDFSKYRIPLCISLLLMLVVALVLVTLSAERVTPLYEGCVTVSVLVHYFTLVSVMLMAAEALLVFRKATKPLEQISNKYNIIVLTICWCK